MRRGTSGLLSLAALAVAGAYLIGTGDHAIVTADPVETSPAAVVPHEFAPGEIEELLASAIIVAELPDLPGYERDCGNGDGCVFGSAWTDDYDGPGGHDGCDTRNQVLAAQMSDVVFKPGTDSCKVVSGTLDDPYTGQRIEFVSGRGTSRLVQIDHVVALSRAWDAGAAKWTLDQRVAFANDLDRNLMAVDGSANQSKSDSGLDEWLPPNMAVHCTYSLRYLEVAVHYQLAITEGDAATAREVCTT